LIDSCGTRLVMPVCTTGVIRVVAVDPEPSVIVRDSPLPFPLMSEAPTPNVMRPRRNG
jgi:hypothetical protein